MVLAIPRVLYSLDGSSHIQISLLQLIYNSTYTAHLKFLKAQYCLLNELGVARYSRDSSWFLRLLKKNKKVLNVCQDSIRWLTRPLAIYFFRVRCKKLNLAKPSFSSRAKYVTKQNCLTRGSCNNRKMRLKSGNGGTSPPESPNGPNNSGDRKKPINTYLGFSYKEHHNQLKLRSETLAAVFPNPTGLLAVLKLVPLKDMNQTVLVQSEINKISLAVEYGFLSIFYKPGFGLHIQLAYKDSFISSSCFNWLFNLQVGSYIERLLLYHLHLNLDKNSVQIFKTQFISYQREYWSYFNYNIKIKNTSGVLSIARIIFNKINLLRIIRIIVPIYGKLFWDSLTNKEQFLFCKNLVQITLENGSYKFINAFLESDQGQIQNNAEAKFVIIYQNQISYKIEKIATSYPMAIKGGVPFKGFTGPPKFGGKYLLKVFLVGAFLLLPAFMGSKNANVRTLIRSTVNTLTTVTNRSYFNNTLSYGPPLAMITGSPIASSKKAQPMQLNAVRSRTPLNVQAVQGVSLTDPNRQTVVVFWDSKKANELIINPTPQKAVDVLVYWTQDGNESLTSQQWVLAQKSKPSTLKDKALVDYLEVQTKEHTNAYDALLQETTLGASDGTTTKIGRNVGTDLIFVDLANESSVHWSIGLCYNEAPQVSNYIIRKIARALACVEQSQGCETFKKTKVFKNFNSAAFEFLKSADQPVKGSEAIISKAVQAVQEIEGAAPMPKPEKKKLVAEFESKVLAVLTFPKGAAYQASHPVPDKVSAQLGLKREVQVCNHTYNLANGSTSYDSPVVNVYDLSAAKDISDMLTSNLDKGKELLNVAISKRINEQVSKTLNTSSSSKSTANTSKPASRTENCMALILLRDAAHDFYTTTRAMVGLSYTNQFLAKYENSDIRVNSNLLSIIGPKLALNQSIIDSCLNNVEIANQKIASIQASIKGNSIQLDASGKQQGVGQYEAMLNNASQAAENLKELDNTVVDLLYQVDAACESFNAYLKVAMINGILHGLLTNKAEPQLDKFVEISVNLACNLSSLESEFSGYNDLDRKYLKQTHLNGSNFMTGLKKLDNALQSSQTTLETTRDNLKKKLDTSSTNLTQNQLSRFRQIQETLNHYCQVIENRQSEFSLYCLKPSIFNVNPEALIQHKAFKKAVNIVTQLYSETPLTGTQQEKLAFDFAAIFSELVETPFYSEALIEADRVASNGINAISIYSTKVANSKKKEVSAALKETVSELKNSKKATTSESEGSDGPEEISTSPKALLEALTISSPAENSNVGKMLMLTSTEAEAVGRYQMVSRPLRTGSAVPAAESTRKARMATTGNVIKPSPQDLALVPRVPKKSARAGHSDEGGSSSS